MTFWSANNVEPTRQYRFTISDGKDIWWWAKTCDKPSFEVETQEHKLINHKFRYPGVATWNDVKISIVDVGYKVTDLYLILASSGYDPTGSFNVEGINKNEATEAFKNNGNFIIHQIDSNGKILEEWVLKNPWISSVTFGNLDYSNDELVSLELNIKYDWAELN